MLFRSDNQGEYDMPSSKPEDPVAREAERKRRVQRRKQDPFYLGDSDDDDEYPPVETLTGDMIDLQPGLMKSTATPTKKRRPQNVQIITDEEMPEGATGSDSEEEPAGDDLFSGIDIQSAVRPDEELTTQSYPMPSVGYDPNQQASEGGDDRKKRKKRKEKRRKKRDQPQGDLLGIGDSPSKPSQPQPAKSSISMAGENKNVKLAYELGVNPGQPDKVMVLFHIRAVGSTLANLEFNITCPMNLKLVQPADTKPAFSIAPNSHNSHRLLFQFQSMVQPQKFKGNLSFEANGSAGSLEFQIGRASCRERV